MNGKQLKNSILQWAIQGKLVPQDPNDEPASVLLERIRAEKARLVKEGKIKKDKNESIIYKGDDNSYYEKFPDGKVVCIDEEIPFEVPQGWEWCKINNIAFVTKLAGFEYTNSIAEHLCSAEYGIPLFKGKNVQDGKIIYEFESYIPEAVSNALPRSQITRKCLLTPYVGTIGNIGIHHVPGKFHLGSNVGKIEFHNEYSLNVVEEYARAFLMSPAGNSELCKHKKATAQESISIEAIRDVYFPLPPIKEQLRIIEKLDEIEILVNKYEIQERRLMSLNVRIYNDLRKSILQEAIQGKLVPQDPNDEPSEKLLERINAEKQKLVKEGKLKAKEAVPSIIFRGDDNKYYEQVGSKEQDITDQIPFDVPDSWSWARLSHIANLFTGNSISETEKNQRYTGVSGMCYIGTKDVGFDSVITYENGVKIPDEFLGKFKVAESNSILLCVEGGSAGRKYGITDREVCFGNKLCCIAPYGIPSKYIFYYIQSASFYDLFTNSMTGIIGGVSVNSIKNILIPIPPENEQYRIIEKVQSLFKSIK